MWLQLSLLTAFFTGIGDALAKKALASNRAQTVAWVRPGWAALILLPFYHWAQPPVSFWDFWHPILWAIPLEVAAALAFHEALKHSPLSLTIPYMAFTPVFILVIGRFFLNEVISTQGIFGIVAVTLGAFILQSPLLALKWSSLKKLIPMEKGPLLVLMVSFIYAFTSFLAKKALLASSPLYFCTIYYSVIALCLLPFQLGSPTWAKELFVQPKLFVVMGLVEAAILIFQFQAFVHGNVAYVVAIKRLSLLLAVLFGWIFFKERHFVSRILGAGLMTLGAILIGLA